MFYLAVFPQFAPHDASGGSLLGAAYLLVFVHSMVNAIWFGAMVLLFGRLQGAVRTPGFQRWLKGITGAVFLGFGAKLAMLRLD